MAFDDLNLDEVLRHTPSSKEAQKAIDSAFGITDDVRLQIEMGNTQSIPELVLPDWAEHQIFRSAYYYKATSGMYPIDAVLRRMFILGVISERKKWENSLDLVEKSY